MSLWQVESTSIDGPWTVFVRCESPFVALELATKRYPWSVLDGIAVKGVRDFVDTTDDYAPEGQQKS